MMEAHEYDRRVKKLNRTERIIMDEARKRGKVTAPMLREPTGNTHGMTVELRHLQALGILREAGRAPDYPGRVGMLPMQYEVVPMAQVEEAAARYETRRKKSKRRRAPRSRIAELRKMEHGDYGAWYRTRKRVIELSQVLSSQFPQMAFWEAAPEDDLEWVAQELADLQDALDVAKDCLQQRKMDDEVRAKIEKLLDTNGRTPEEAAAFRKGAERLQTKLDQSM